MVIKKEERKQKEEVKKRETKQHLNVEELRESVKSGAGYMPRRLPMRWE